MFKKSKIMTMNSAGAFVAALALSTTSFAAENLTVETASPGGAPHMSVSYLAQVAGEAGVAELQVQAGQVSTNSVLNTAEGKTDIASTPLILPFLLKMGRGPYSKQGKKGAALASNLRALYPYNFGVYALFGFQSNGITSYDQLKGKTIYNGPPRGGALVTARQILQLVAGIKEGKDYKGVQVNWGQSRKTITDGTADINMEPTTIPSGSVTAALAAGKINIISIPKKIWDSKKFQRFAQSPGSAPVAIKASKLTYGKGVTVISEDGMFRSISITGAEIVNKKMSNKLAKALTAVYIKNLDKLKIKTPWAKNINAGVLNAKLSGFCGLAPMKYHPGAVVAWEEAGYKVPDCAKP